jgi:hypothetical protein
MVVIQRLIIGGVTPFHSLGLRGASELIFGFSLLSYFLVSFPAYTKWGTGLRRYDYEL